MRITPPTNIRIRIKANIRTKKKIRKRLKQSLTNKKKISKTRVENYSLASLSPLLKMLLKKKRKNLKQNQNLGS